MSEKTHFQFALIHGPDIPGSYAILLFTALDLASITSYIHTWVYFGILPLVSFSLGPSHINQHDCTNNETPQANQLDWWRYRLTRQKAICFKTAEPTATLRPGSEHQKAQVQAPHTTVLALTLQMQGPKVRDPGTQSCPLVDYC